MPPKPEGQPITPDLLRSLGWRECHYNHLPDDSKTFDLPYQTHKLKYYITFNGENQLTQVEIELPPDYIKSFTYSYSNVQGVKSYEDLQTVYFLLTNEELKWNVPALF
jgi:serine protease inhibitor